MAAISGASAGGFTVSGCWRQQFDWAVIEWNRDNVFEHPLLRNLPDGNLSGLRLSYEESRTNCIAMDSSLYPTVDLALPTIWTEASGVEPYRVRLRDYATPAVWRVTPATLQFELQGTLRRETTSNLPGWTSISTISSREATRWPAPRPHSRQ